MREREEDFCWCCGYEIEPDLGYDPNWCGACLEHISPENLQPWDRTYFALHGEPCPFQVGTLPDRTEDPPESERASE